MFPLVNAIFERTYLLRGCRFILSRHFGSLYQYDTAFRCIRQGTWKKCIPSRLTKPEIFLWRCKKSTHFDLNSTNNIDEPKHLQIAWDLVRKLRYLVRARKQILYWGLWSASVVLSTSRLHGWRHIMVTWRHRWSISMRKAPTLAVIFILSHILDVYIFSVGLPPAPKIRGLQWTILWWQKILFCVKNIGTNQFSSNAGVKRNFWPLRNF